MGVAIAKHVSRAVYGHLMSWRTSEELAVHASKTEGKGGYAIYDDSMHAAVIDRFAMEAALDRAPRNRNRW